MNTRPRLDSSISNFKRMFLPTTFNKMLSSKSWPIARSSLVRIHVDRLELADTTDKGGSTDTCGKVGEGAVSAVETVLAELEDLVVLWLELELEAMDRAHVFFRGW